MANLIRARIGLKQRWGTSVTHKVFVDQVENEQELLDELVGQGIIV